MSPEHAKVLELVATLRALCNAAPADSDADRLSWCTALHAVMPLTAGPCFCCHMHAGLERAGLLDDGPRAVATSFSALRGVPLWLVIGGLCAVHRAAVESALVLNCARGGL